MSVSRLRLWLGLGLILVVGPVLLTLSGFLLWQAVTKPPRTTVNPTIFTTENYQVNPDPELGFVTRPNFSTIQHIGPTETVIYTDDLGGRISRPGFPSDQQVDLITVGCSQAWGHGVSNEATFTSYLAKNLGLRTRNLAVSGYGGVGSLLRIGRAMNLKPRFIVYGFWFDHLNRNLARCVAIDSPVCLQMPVIRFDQDGQPYILPPDDAEAGIRLTRRWFMETAIGTDQYRSLWTDLYWTTFRLWREAHHRLGGEQVSTRTSEAQRLMATEFVLIKMKEKAASVGAELIVVFIPNYLGTTVEAPRPELVTMVRKHRIVFVDMTRPFHLMKQQGVNIGIPGDGHMTEAAHQAVAEVVIQVIGRSNAAQGVLSLRKA